MIERAPSHNTHFDHYTALLPKTKNLRTYSKSETITQSSEDVAPVEWHRTDEKLQRMTQMFKQDWLSAFVKMPVS